MAGAIARSFMQAYPKIMVQTERSGAERVLQRLIQEYASGIHNADVIESSDITSFELFKGKGWLAQFLPEEVKQLLAGRGTRFRRSLCHGARDPQHDGSQH